MKTINVKTLSSAEILRMNLSDPTRVQFHQRGGGGVHADQNAKYDAKQRRRETRKEERDARYGWN